jgi:Tol biopolymer transport system component
MRGSGRMVTAPDGADFAALTPHDPRHDLNEYRAWSPDGRTIAFSAMPDWEPERLYLMDVDGGNQGRISDGL